MIYLCPSNIHESVFLTTTKTTIKENFRMLNYFRLNKIKSELKLSGYILLVIMLLMGTSCNKEHDDDIRKLEELKQDYLWNNANEKGYGYIYKLKDEALRLKNDRYVGTAYYYLSNYYSLELSKRDSVPFALEEAKKYFRKANYKQGEILAESTLAHYLIEEGSYELALKNIYALLKEVRKSDDYYQQANAYAVLGKAYLYLGMSESALRVFDRASAAYQKVDSVQDVSREYHFHLLMQSLAANHAKKNDLALSYIYSYKAGLDKLKLSEDSKKNLTYVADVSIAEYLLDMDSVKESEPVIGRILSYINEVGNVNSTQSNAVNATLSKFYLKKHDYNRASQYLDSLVIDPNINPCPDYITMQELKADILFAKGDYRDAFEVKDKLMRFSDSIKSSSTSKQLDRFEDRLQMEMQEKENELNAEYTYTIIISLSIICVLLMLLLYMTARNSKKLKKKNELIFSQFRNLDKYADNVTRNDFTAADELNTNDSEHALFEKVKHHLYTTEAFRSSDISRDSLALELGTNRQYLTQTIQDNTGMTFMEYINEMRLEYARRLLCYNTDLSIDEVYISSGFSSKSTFYRLFKRKYDITPTEMREIAVQIK